MNKEKLDFVLSLGDLGDGHNLDEVLAVKETLKTCKHPVKFVIGNHDLVLRSDKEFSEVVGIPYKAYDFCIENYRFIVLNAFENSIYSRDKEKEQAYRDYVDGQNGRLFQRWPGIMNAETYNWLEKTLEDAKNQNQEVIMFSHVPVWSDACLRDADENEPLARIADHIELLDLMDNYKNIRSYIAGHYHKGGIALRKGVLHKTVRSICDYPEPTACIFTADKEKITIDGIGNESNFIHTFEFLPTYICGTAPEGSYVMTNCGEIQPVGQDGKFKLQVPCQGVYSIRAVKDGCKDVHIPFITAPADGVNIEFMADPSRKLYVGKTDGPAVLRITDNGKPVRWFDISGRNYGEYTPPTPIWTAHSENFWTNSEYAFTASGNVNIKVLPKHPYLRENNWYKGEPHNHLFHGEGHYAGNVQQSAFIGKAEGYDWLCFSQYHGNDGSVNDYYGISEYLSDNNNLFFINDEFPKSRSNHFASFGVASPRLELNAKVMHSLEAADKYVWQRGGITIPVHPFEGHMSFRQFPLWLNCAPDKMPCIDFYYQQNYKKKYADDYWFMLLNRGYTIGCFATSDGAFDVGRTPGSDRGCTYVNMSALSEENIMDAIKKGRTMVSYDCAALIFSIDNYISGDVLYPNNQQRKLKIKAFWQKNKSAVIRIVRNGVDIKNIPVKFAEDETPVDFEMNIRENENAWYVAFLDNEKGEPCSVASPIYFRNEEFVAPKVIPLPKNIPTEFLEMFEKLEPDDLAQPELIDRVGAMLEELNNKDV